MLGLLIGLVMVMTAPIEAVASHNGHLNIQVSNPILVGKNCNPDTFKGCRTGESMRFLANTLKVHKGDTLTFDFAGFHTASLLPTDTDWLTFRQDNAGGVGRAYSVFVPDPDDSTEEGAPADKPAVKINNAVAFPSIDGAPVTCGATDDPCSYDGKDVVNSGFPFAAPPNVFTVKVDANPGQRFFVMCFIHPHMILRINIVDDATPATTQTEIDTARAQMIAFDQEWAEETDAKLINGQSSHTTASGQKVYDVSVGYDSHWANLNGFYPARTTVPKGATVRFHYSQSIYEDHTTTMPAPGAFQLFDEFFVFNCDPDGDGGAGPDTPDPGTGPPCGGDNSKVEIDMSSRVMFGTGNGTFRGKNDIEHSGIRSAQYSNADFDVKFNAKSNKKGWKVFCMLHPMQTRIVVK